MQHFFSGDTAAAYFTLSELVTLPDPYFLFEFKPRVTAPAITVVLRPVLSNERSDCFEFDVDAVFGDRPRGFYDYRVFEQDSADNTDVNAAGLLLERGTIQLHAENPFKPTAHQQTTAFIQPK